jgi:hypothetical protein
MKKVMTTVKALVVASLFLVACSKDRSIENNNNTQPQVDVAKIAPAPMPKDSVEIEQLDQPGFN